MPLDHRETLGLDLCLFLYHDLGLCPARESLPPY